MTFQKEEKLPKNHYFKDVYGNKRLRTELDKELYIRRLEEKEGFYTNASRQGDFNDNSLVVITYNTIQQEQKALDAVAFLAQDQDAVTLPGFAPENTLTNSHIGDQHLFTDEENRPLWLSLHLVSQAPIYIRHPQENRHFLLIEDRFVNGQDSIACTEIRNVYLLRQRKEELSKTQRNQAKEHIKPSIINNLRQYFSK